MTPSEELVGRSREIDVLTRAFERARDGVPGFWLITGEAGIGKTRLLRELSGRANAAGMRVLAGTATETGRHVPFLPLLAPLRQALSDGARSHPDEPDDRAAETVALAIDGRAEPVEVASIDTARLFEAIHDLVVRAPTLLTVDDVHWADASTIAVLDYLAHRIVDAPILVVASARDDLASLERLAIADGRRFAPLPLARLGRDDVRRLADGIRDQPLDRERLDRLHRRSAGNPLFVEQLLEGSLEPGRSTDDGAAEGDVPLALQRLLQRRLQDLAPSARSTIEALAVLGGAAPADRLAAVAGLAQEEADAGLRIATTAGIAMLADGGHAFRHPLYGEVVLADLAGPDLRRLHARAAAALVDIGSAAAIADHWWRADAPEAWATACEAAAVALGSFAFVEARTHLERAIARWPANAPGLVDALLDAAHAAWVSGDPGGAAQLAERAEALEPARPECAIAVAAYLWDEGRRPEAVAAFERAAILTNGDPSPERRARGEFAAGRRAIAIGRVRDGAAHAMRAARLAREAGVRALEAEGLSLSAMSLGFADSLEGIPGLERAATLGLDLRAPHIVGHTHQFLVDLLGLAGRTDEATRIARRGIAASDRLGTARTHGSDLRGRLALLLLDRGRWTEAEELLDQADRRAFPALARAFLAMRRGSFESAESWLADAATAGSIGGPGSLGGWLEVARVELAWLQGDAAEATRRLDLVPPMPGVWGLDIGAWSARWRARFGRLDPAATEAAAATAGGHPDPHLAGAITAEIRASAVDAGSPEHAQAWARAVARWAEAGRPWDEALANLSLAQAWFAARDGRRGRVALEQAQATATSLDASPLLVRIESLARRARVKVGAARHRADPDAPTSRELDVLRLLAEGRTNPQIAEALFLSRKTVGIHVSRLLDKLGAGTRGEAVAIARRRGLLD